jgi:hypothetical protein
MVYNTQSYWVFGLCASSDILKSRKHGNFGNWICFRPQVRREKTTPLGLLERTNLNQRFIYFYL